MGNLQTKPWFSRLLQYTTRKWSQSILEHTHTIAGKLINSRQCYVLLTWNNAGESVLGDVLWSQCIKFISVGIAVTIGHRRQHLHNKHGVLIGSAAVRCRSSDEMPWPPPLIDFQSSRRLSIAMCYCRRSVVCYCRPSTLEQSTC